MPEDGRSHVVALLRGVRARPTRGRPAAGTPPWTAEGTARPALLHRLEECGGFPAVLAALAEPTPDDRGGWEFGLRVVLDGLAAGIGRADTDFEGNGCTTRGGGA